MRSMANARPHRADALRAVFGSVVDTFSTGAASAVLFNSLQTHELGSGRRALEHLHEGIDVAEYVWGTRARGWCGYRVRAHATPGAGEQAIGAKLDFELRYCVAGHQLYGFDQHGRVRRTWDAAGLPRRLPVAEPVPYDKRLYNDEKVRAKLEKTRLRNQLVARFVDALVDGKLTDATQVDALMMANGADSLSPHARKAMQRMARH